MPTRVLCTIAFGFLLFETGNLAQKIQDKFVRQIIPKVTLSLDEIDKVLTLPTRDIPNLNLLLRWAHFQIDADNPYTMWFLRQKHCPITVGSYNHSTDSVVRPKRRRDNDDDEESFVIATEMQQLATVAQRFARRAGTFFFIFTDTVDAAQLRSVFSDMWREFLIYKNYMLTSDGVLIYDPFEFNFDLMSYGKVINYLGLRDLERTLFSDMRGYPLRVQIFRSVYSQPIQDTETNKLLRVEGMDGRVADLLQEKMNFSMVLMDPDPDYFGERNENGTYNGAIGSIIENKIDLCLTGFFVKDYMVPEMDFSVAVYDDQLCIYVAKAQRIPPSILPLFSVGYKIWMVFVLAAFACGFIWWLMRRLNLWLGTATIGQEPLATDNRYLFLSISVDTWVVWVRVNILKYPPFHSERIFVATLSLVSVIFGAIFESSLATVYIHPMHYPDIHSLQELDESGLKIIYKYSSMADDLFFNETSPLYASLNSKLTHLKDLRADVILDISRHGGKAGVTRHSSLMTESLHFIIGKQIWVIPECPKYYTISYTMPRDAPWQATVNNLLLRFVEAGLIVKWIDDIEMKFDIRARKNHSTTEDDNGFKALTVPDLQMPFYVIVIGGFLAAISFGIELCFRPE